MADAILSLFCSSESQAVFFSESGRRIFVVVVGHTILLFYSSLFKLIAYDVLSSHSYMFSSPTCQFSPIRVIPHILRKRDVDVPTRGGNLLPAKNTHGEKAKSKPTNSCKRRQVARRRIQSKKANLDQQPLNF